jgi:hypothetical protein
MSLEGMLKKILVGVAILVIAAIIGLFINSAWNDYAEVNYQIQGANSFYATGTNYLVITLKIGNDGNIGVVPTSEIYVINATIIGVSIPNVAQYELSNYCHYNDTVVTISNLTVAKGISMSDWATINITPNEGVLSFSVSASVTLPSDWLHPNSKPMRNLPTELFYNQTSPNSYTLLQGQS